MRRRQFLGLAAMTAGAELSRGARLFAQPAVRGAVVIGVNKAGNLPLLRGAASDALKMDSWLRGEGFTTRVLVDERPGSARGTVRFADIYDAVAELSARDTLEQLVIYFSGHGFVKNNSEFWMLSNAPDNPNEAISLMESYYLAARSGISNVAFISDACRSTIASLEADGVHGSLIFSTRAANPRIKTDVDRFLATGLGQVSNEVSVSANAFEGIYTAAFLLAFTHPDPTMVQTVRGLRVVPNRKLEDYLLREVRSRIRSTPTAQEQDPDAYVVSKDDVYIGRVTGSPSSSTATNTAEPALSSVARAQLLQVGVRGLDSGAVAPIGTPGVNDVAGRSGFTAAKDRLLRQPPDPNALNLRTGLVVSGATPRDVVTGPQLTARVLGPAGGAGEFVRIQVDMTRTPAGSVVLDFGGFGTVVAALDNYVGYVSVDDGRVVNVSYLPSYVGGSDLTRLNRLHATVAAATRFGVFRIEGRRDSRSQAARTMADSIRVMKGIDPTLGIYAAYAYAEADVAEQTQSVMAYMRQDLRVDLFDVAMLAGVLVGKNSAQITSPPIVPMCPMLSQGWNLLRVNEVSLGPEVSAAREHVRDALWTTFDGEGVALVIRAIREGRAR
jgi:hypothetical protein